MATLSEAGASKIVDQARDELNKVLEAQGQEVVVKTKSDPPTLSDTPSSKVRMSDTPSGKVRLEVTEAAVRFTEGVDVITETLILILGKFKSLQQRTTIGMGFGACVLVICLLVARQSWKTALIEEGNTHDIALVTAQLKEALSKLDSIQKATNSTEQKVDAVKQTADSHPSIEIVPDKGRPGKAKVVIRPAVTDVASPPPAAGFGAGHGRLGGGHKMPTNVQSDEAPPAAAAPVQQDLVEIPIQIPK